MEVNKVYNGDCLEVLKTFSDNSIDSCVTDPPYGISFMNKHWDYQIPSVDVWKEILRVLKPGGYVLCACGTRTQHRMAVNIEDAGFEIRDVITWHYGSGFPKSLNIGKEVDKLQGNEREDLGVSPAQRLNKPNSDIYEAGIRGKECRVTKGNSEYEGWGTALKPATEFWTLARKPIEESTVAKNVLKYGTGGLNIEGSRIETDDDNRRDAPAYSGLTDGKAFQIRERFAEEQKQQGRFPSNVILDEFMGDLLDKQSGKSVSTDNIRYNKARNKQDVFFGQADKIDRETSGFNDEGGASRFFYCPKADGFERNKGVKGEGKFMDESREVGSAGGTNPRNRGAETKRQNHHPTVKPIDLMRYLVKLVTVKGGTCIDPYCGSGTTLIGAKLELINYVGIDRESDYCKISEARTSAWNPDKYKPQSLFQNQTT